MLRKARQACLLFVLLILVGCQCEHRDISMPYTIQVTGTNYEWHILYPGLDNILGTRDDIHGKQNIYLPVGIKINLKFTSVDYLYFMDLPEFNQIGMAVVDQFHSLDLTPRRTGRFALRGNQMCAFTHESLIGEVKVCSPYKFRKWRERQSRKTIHESN